MQRVFLYIVSLKLASSTVKLYVFTAGKTPCRFEDLRNSYFVGLPMLYPSLTQGFLCGVAFTLNPVETSERGTVRPRKQIGISLWLYSLETSNHLSDLHLYVLSGALCHQRHRAAVNGLSSPHSKSVIETV